MGDNFVGWAEYLSKVFRSVWDSTNSALRVRDDRMNFNGQALKVDASVTVGNINIAETHITDSATDLPADVVSDGTNGALVVKQNSQPLPTGAATSAKQDTSNGLLTTIEANQDTGNASLATIAAVDFATATKQDTGNNSLIALESKDFATQTTLNAINTATGAKTDAAVQTDSNGSVVAFLRGIVKFLADLVETRTGTPTKTSAINVQIGPGDIISNLPVVVDFPHHQVHEGEMWQWYFFGAVNATTKDVRISVPILAATTRTPHLIPEVFGDNTTITVSLYEGTTFTNSGTDDSTRIRNRNRNVGGSPNTKVYVSGGTTLTPNALGTLLWQDYLFTSKASTNGARDLVEWDLLSNTEYLLRVVTTGNGSVMIRLHWYEDKGV